MKIANPVQGLWTYFFEVHKISPVTCAFAPMYRSSITNNVEFETEVEGPQFMFNATSAPTNFY